MTDLGATLAWLLLVSGWFLRRRRSAHVPLVLSGITLDLAIVVFLEVTRGVVETTVQAPLSGTRWVHVASSLIAVLLYFPTLYLGFRMLRAAPPSAALRTSHRRVATLALVARTIGFATMWLD